MYAKILVPLDGSAMAECVLPYLRWFTDVSRVKEVTLLRVVEPFHISGGLEDRVESAEKKRIEKDEIALAREYLEKIAAQLNLKGIEVKPVVTEGKPSQAVAKYVSSSGVDLIIMAAHGRSGLHHWIRGSVADGIIDAARVPVFLVTPDDRPPKK